MRNKALAALGTLALVVASGGIVWPVTHTNTVTKTVRQNVKTIYVTNRPGSGITNRTIKNDISAWEKAANGLFSRTWDAPQVRIKLAKQIPLGAWGAIFQNKGDVKGALAYHTSVDGVPRIVVYSGVGNFYGFNNSVSFTHELFELLADPTITRLEQGWPDPIIWTGKEIHFVPITVDWAAEVCDPVEAYAYSIGKVRISDWITPNWFNDEINVKGKTFDYLGKVQAPLTILKGGYAQFFVYGQWYAVTDFRKNDPASHFFHDGLVKGRHVKVVKKTDVIRK